MPDEQNRTLTDKIEETVEGVLRFTIRFSTTVLSILFRPLSCDRRLLTAKPEEKRFVRPLTFLTIGGFVFSTTISVYPKGFLGLINIIWFGDEIGETILNRWQEAFKLTGLLLASFPVLFTVAAGAGLAGLAIRSPSRRAEFLTLNYYLFGYQAFLLFSFLFFAIGAGVLPALFGVEVKEVLGIDDFQVSPYVVQAGAIALAILFLSALLMPCIALNRWALRAGAGRRAWERALFAVLLSVYSFGMLAAMSYTASTPAAFKQVASPPGATVKIHFLEDPRVEVEPTPDGEGHQASIDLHVAIENVPESHLIAGPEKIDVGIVGEFDSGEESFFAIDDLTLRGESGVAERKLLIEKGGLRAYRMSGVARLPERALELMLDRAARPTETNHYNFFVNIRIRLDSDTIDRRLYLDVDDIFPPATPVSRLRAPQESAP